MTKTPGFVIEGNDSRNILNTYAAKGAHGNWSVFNVIEGGGGKDILNQYTMLGEFVQKQYGVQLYGGAGDDYITDSFGNDTLSGGNGHDIIIWDFGGHDVVDGGDGIDALSVQYDAPKPLLLDNLTITGVEVLGIAREARIRDFDLTQFASIAGLGTPATREALGSDLYFLGKAQVEHVNFTSGNWLLEGSNQDDVFDVSHSPCAFTINGGHGNDKVAGGDGTNLIDGQDGNDTLSGGLKNDTIDGGAGDDSIRAGGGEDRITDIHGNNTLHGGDDDDFILAKGISRLYGDGGNDALYQTGSAYIDGGDGDDEIWLSHMHRRGPDGWTVLGGEGNDVLHTSGDLSGLRSSGVEVLDLGVRAKVTIAENTLDSFEKIKGILDGRVIFSSGGHFTWKHQGSEKGTETEIVGSSGRDHIDLSTSVGGWHIDGGDGKDTFIGGSGINDFTGGGGSDTYVFSPWQRQTTIEDFNAKGPSHDIVDLSNFRSIKDFEDLLAHYTSTSSTGLTISIDKSDFVLKGITLADLHATDFIF